MLFPYATSGKKAVQVVEEKETHVYVLKRQLFCADTVRWLVRLLDDNKVCL